MGDAEFLPCLIVSLLHPYITLMLQLVYMHTAVIFAPVTIRVLRHAELRPCGIRSFDL